LKESEYFFRESQRAAGIGSYKADLTNNTWKTSEFLEEIFGIDDSYPRNIQSWMDLIHPTDKAMMDRYLKEEVIAGRKPFSKEYRIIHKKDNETKWVNGLGEIKLDNNILSLIGTIQDITERKKTEEEKAKLEAQLQQAQKMESLGILVAGVAHNINNVLAIIMGTASFREQSVIEPSDLKAYKTIGNACKRGRDVVRSLMQFARPSFSNQAPIELHALIKEVCILLENTTSNRIKIIQTFSKEPSWISGDAGTINHALLNLCLNSVDAMPNGGTLSLRTTIPENEWVEVSVEDNGTGIAPEVLVQVMEPFYTTKGMGKGTGLGLSMTYGVIKAHGGSIDIASQPGQGTIVKLRFPRIPAPVESEPEFANAPAPSLGSMKVFLVDDDEDIRLLMTRMLKKAGVGAVETAASGEEALEKLLSGELPDVLILDQNMPGMRGDQLMARVRDRYSDLPILFSSGQPDIESWAILNQPKVALISKPFTMDEIQAKLAQFAHEIIPKG
jgi:PAS domain S-box-containing protein